MTPEQRYEQMWLIHDEALRLAPDRREAYLDARCAGDPSLRAEVARLLAHAGGGDRPGFLEAPCPLNVKAQLLEPRSLLDTAPSRETTVPAGAAGGGEWPN